MFDPDRLPYIKNQNNEMLQLLSCLRVELGYVMSAHKVYVKPFFKQKNGVR